MRYVPVTDGDGIELKSLPRKKGKAWRVLRVACCDCGLIHSLAFAVEDNGNLGMAVRVEKRATAARRRRADLRGLVLPRKKRKG